MYEPFIWLQYSEALLIKIHNPCIIESRLAIFFYLQMNKRFILCHKEMSNATLLLIQHREIHLHIHELTFARPGSSQLDGTK
jgi:hypothetical protein